MKPPETNLTLALSQIAKVQEELWGVQLQEYPDSVRLTPKEVIDACYERSPTLALAMHDWDHDSGPDYENESDRRAARSLKGQELILQHQLNVSRLVVIAAVQSPCGVFYKCGKNEDGTYRWMGFRFGFEGSEYQSGFGRY